MIDYFRINYSKHVVRSTTYRLEIPEDGSKFGSTPGRHGRPNSSISISESCGDKRDPVKAPGGDI